MKESSGSPQVVRFGAFEFDPRSGELRKEGIKLHLQGQPVEILATLLARPGQVVTREELQKKLWPADTFVDFEHSLNAAIKRLREVLGDDADNPRFVETIPRRGYRLIAPAEVSSRVAGRRPARTQFVLGAIAVFVLVAVVVVLNVRSRRAWSLAHSPTRINSLAVLPLENLSRDPEQEYFADGMTDELIAQLAQIGALRVISRTSVMRYKGTTKPLAEIARELNVDAVVEGSVLRSGDRVRITAQLIEAPSDTHLFARSYERDLRDVLALQNDVARAIASEVRVKLTPQEQARLASPRPAVNPEAYEACLRGLSELLKLSVPGEMKSIGYFERAMQLDPSYAPAYSGLASSYAILGQQEILPAQEAYAKARKLALKALELDETLAEAHAVLGWIHRNYDWDWPAAEREFKRAVELDPGSAAAHHGYGALLDAVGRWEEALAEEKRALQLDPLSSFVNGQLALSFLERRSYPEAIEQARKTLELDPSNSRAYFVLGMVAAREGRYDQAIAELRKSVELSGRPDVLAELGAVYAHAGKRAETRKILAELREQAKHRNVSPLNFAILYAGLGERDQAFAWLERAYQERSPFLISLRGDYALDGLRSDPRYADLLRRMGLLP